MKQRQSTHTHTTQWIEFKGTGARGLGMIPGFEWSWNTLGIRTQSTGLMKMALKKMKGSRQVFETRTMGIMWFCNVFAVFFLWLCKLCRSITGCFAILCGSVNYCVFWIKCIPKNVSFASPRARNHSASTFCRWRSDLFKVDYFFFFKQATTFASQHHCHVRTYLQIKSVKFNLFSLCKCKITFNSVASCMCASAREPTAA